MWVSVAVQRGLNPRKTLVGFGGRRRGKRLGSEKREESRLEEKERVRKVFAVAPPMAWLHARTFWCGNWKYSSEVLVLTICMYNCILYG